MKSLRDTHPHVPRSAQSRADLRESVETELREFFNLRCTVAQAYGGEFERLWRIASDQVLGGKLVRPVLMLETFEALVADQGESASPPTDPEIVIRIAAAVELLHFSFLLHDDVIDGDLTRRGRPNLIGVLDTSGGSDSRLRHWARTGGVLMGDMLLAATHQIFARVDLADETRSRLLDLLDHTITESVAGEQLDVGLSDGVITPDLGTILAMSASKTAAYTFEFPLRTAAILAGSGPATEQTLMSAGHHLGLAFQLQDDLLSVFGTPSSHGKDPFSDLREGKQTAITCYARMTSAWPSIEPTFGRNDLTIEQGKALRSHLVECGAQRFAEGLVDEQLTAFLEVLAESEIHEPISPSVRRVLLCLMTELDGRRR